MYVSNLTEPFLWEYTLGRCVLHQCRCMSCGLIFQVWLPLIHAFCDKMLAFLDFLQIDDEFTDFEKFFNLLWVRTNKKYLKKKSKKIMENFGNFRKFFWQFFLFLVFWPPIFQRDNQKNFQKVQNSGLLFYFWFEKHTSNYYCVR